MAEGWNNRNGLDSDVLDAPREYQKHQIPPRYFFALARPGLARNPFVLLAAKWIMMIDADPAIFTQGSQWMRFLPYSA